MDGSLSLSPAFFTKTNPYVEASIPDNREPEFGFILENMADAQTIYQKLCKHPDIRISDTPPQTKNRYLVSLAEDTVDEQGNPTRLIAVAGLERRRRQSLNPNREFERYDISYKTADKTSQCRKEWEANTKSIAQDEDKIRAVIRPDYPDIATIDVRSFCVSSVCVTSRASYDVEYTDPETKSQVIFEVCNDACLFTPPNADAIVGYRRETELEAKKILLPMDLSKADSNTLSLLLDRAINGIRGYLWDSKFKGKVEDSFLSKIAHANQSVDDYYQPTSETMGISGIDWSLLQNVRAIRFLDESKRTSLLTMTATLPKPKLLSPHNKQAEYSGFFPKI